MRILMVSSELAPFASTGDFGDAVGALARALVRRGHEVTAVLPDYGGAEGQALDEGAERLGVLGGVPTSAGPRSATAFVAPASLPGLRVVRVRCPPLFDRPGLYGAPEDFGDNPDRFWLMSVAAVAVCRRMKWTPDVAHAHDWHAGWVPAVLRSQPEFQSVPTVYTCYDLALDGPAPLEWARQVGVVPDLLKPEGIEYYGRVSFAKVGLRFADVVVVSSPESADPDEGLAGVVRARGAAVTRIPRSIDAEANDPGRDLGLPERFSADAPEGKKTCKRRLQAAMGLEVNPQAVVILVAEDPELDGSRVSPIDPQVQWLPLEGLPAGLRRLAFAGADAFLEPSADAWSAHARVAERYGLAQLMPETADTPPDAYRYDAAAPDGIAEAVNRLVADYSSAGQWQASLRDRLGRDPEAGVARYETLFRQVVGGPAGPPIPWAANTLLERLRSLGA